MQQQIISTGYNITHTIFVAVCFPLRYFCSCVFSIEVLFDAMKITHNHKGEELITLPSVYYLLYLVNKHFSH